jgi:Fe(3+) dicitrate transport protein
MGKVRDREAKKRDRFSRWRGTAAAGWPRRFLAGLFAVAVLAAGAPGAPLAEEAVPVMPRVDVIGTLERLERIPGSGDILDEETLVKSRVFTVNEALRKVSGVHVRDEEGFGVRPNIGIRGRNPTRSSKLMLLEDGIPLVFAPYGDSANYYFPPIDRFERIEVLKGAGQILFGPQTVGGVVNFITPAPPWEPGGSIALIGGNRDYFNGHLRFGGRNILLDYTRKEGDGARDNIHSRLDDFNFKTVIDLGGAQALTLRGNYYTETSNVTYSGLTDAEFRNFGARYNPFKNDFFYVDRYGGSATHEVGLGGGMILTTNLYGSIVNRHWWRQSSTTTDPQCGPEFLADRIAGLPVDPDACDSIQGRLREYYTWGIEPRLRVDHTLFGVRSETELGARAHYETQDRRQLNGTAPTARTGAIVEDNERRTQAYSGFFQNLFLIGNWTVTPGIRVEWIEHERTNRLAAGGTGVTGKDDLFELIPALGVTYGPFEGTTVFAGVHRGFAPPRTEDLITNAGGSVDIDAEKSWNYELGVRSRPARGVGVQATLFRNDYDREIAVGSIAGGSVPLSTGETLYQGAELSGRVDGGEIFDTPHNVYLQAAFTYLPTAKMTSPFVRVDTGEFVQGDTTGNRVPYAPKRQLTAALGYAHPSGLDGQVEAVYVGEQYSDFLNTEVAPPDGNGQAGKIASHTVWNAAVNYLVPRTGLTLFATVKNIADKTYIVDRTRGILPGSPRLIHAGVKYVF